MTFPSVFEKDVCDQLVQRIQLLSTQSQAKWGKMDVAQMLAHCSVTYEFIFTDKHKKPNAFTKFMLKLFVKKVVCTSKPYKQSSPTAPAFKMVEQKNFEEEKNKLIDYIYKVQELGGDYFDGKESHSFGVLTLDEWNTMFYKHLDYHLSQFSV